MNDTTLTKAEQMLDRINEMQNDYKDKQLKIKASTQKIAAKYLIGNMTDTIEFLCEVAQEAIEKSKQKKDEANPERS